MKDLIKKLVETPGPSGHEEQIRALIRSEVAPFADEIQVDAMGSLIVRKGRKTGAGKRIMIAGHMDEIGVMVTHIDDNGFLRFTSIGGVFPHTCIGSRVLFMNGVKGVIYTETITDYKSMPSLDKLYIDVGASNRDKCPVSVGDSAVFDRPFLDMGDRIASKALDDRIAAAIMIESLKQVKDTPNELFFVFTVQEEVGLRGATTAAYHVDPEIGIAVDVCDSGDTPKGEKVAVSLGKGPTVKIFDPYIVSDKRLIEWMIDTAEKNNIPYQREVLLEGGTDAAAIQLTRAGVPAICMSIATRYIHTPSEMVDMNDVENAVKLLTALLSSTTEL